MNITLIITMLTIIIAASTSISMGKEQKERKKKHGRIRWGHEVYWLTPWWLSTCGAIMCRYISQNYATVNITLSQWQWIIFSRSSHSLNHTFCDKSVKAQDSIFHIVISISIVNLYWRSLAIYSNWKTYILIPHLKIYFSQLKVLHFFPKRKDVTFHQQKKNCSINSYK